MTLLPYASLALGFTAAGAFLGWLSTRRDWRGMVLGAVFGLATCGLFLIAARPVFVG